MKNNLKQAIGTHIGIIDGDFEGYNGTIISHDEGRTAWYYSIELDNPVGCPYVIGVSDADIIILQS